MRFVDPDGMFAGEFWNEKGKVIGNDGINDGKIYIIKTTETSFDSRVPSAGISNAQRRETEKFIENNSGNTAAFQSNTIAYDNSVEIESSSSNRQAMVDEVSKDNGRGGTIDANNREYGGVIRDGIVAVAPPGGVTDIKKNGNTVTIELPGGAPSFHSHASGTYTPPNNNIGASSSISSSTSQNVHLQAPSPVDINSAGKYTHYEFARRTNEVYIYNKQGIQAIIPTTRFVTPKR